MEDHAAGSKTPPPASGIRTPPAPRLGYQDEWPPYAPRKSARISAQQSANRTPSPSSRATPRRHNRSPRVIKAADSQNNGTSINMPSPMSSPQKKHQPNRPDSERRVSGLLTVEGTAGAAAALGLKNKAPRSAPATTISQATGMLPTPSKTPQNPPSEATATQIRSFARNLFHPDEEPSASNQKGRPKKKYTGLGLDSFTAEEMDDDIEIFTDSQDRVPQKDDSAENPFFGDANGATEPMKRRLKRHQIRVPGEGLMTVEEASKRDDGMVYVFRGKTTFIKYAQNTSDEGEAQDQSAADLLHKPLTRSDVKPRLLFPTKHHVEDEDEEASTDIDEFEMDAYPETPNKPYKELAITPEAPKFAPISPPDTKRTTRSANRIVDGETPVKGSGRISPFDSWQRMKDQGSTSGTKRQADSLAPASSKRSRT